MVIQDEGSQLVALLVGQGKAILDCCAAPGGKTRIIAQRNPNAAVVAMDVHPRRAALVRGLVSDSNVQVVAADARRIPLANTFDRILVDVPCTGTGTLARNPEIKWRLTPDDVLRLQAYQIEILTATMKHMADDGRIVYSTCSLEPEENEAVIERVLAAAPSIRIFDCSEQLRVLARDGELVWQDVESLLSGPYFRTIPGVHPCDGFFAAVLEKK
jgi:16S rRNA (cytosine967-C5)-methyltransferase